jgi:hypothetical protein
MGTKTGMAEVIVSAREMFKLKWASVAKEDIIRYKLPKLQSYLQICEKKLQNATEPDSEEAGQLKAVIEKMKMRELTLTDELKELEDKKNDTGKQSIPSDGASLTKADFENKFESKREETQVFDPQMRFCLLIGNTDYSDWSSDVKNRPSVKDDVNLFKLGLLDFGF